MFPMDMYGFHGYLWIPWISMDSIENDMFLFGNNMFLFEYVMFLIGKDIFLVVNDMFLFENGVRPPQ